MRMTSGPSPRQETIRERFARIDRLAAERKVKPHFVYRAFDRYGLLLYVGCTVNLRNRMSAHRSSSPWTSYLTEVREQSFPDQASALAAEAEAIATEGPFFNAQPEHTAGVQASIREADRRMHLLGIHWDTSEDYYARRDEMREAIRADFPFVDEDERRRRYLAARLEAKRATRKNAA